ncbi:DUF4328 domain-containing protein [Streptomyces netropsis]|uniref:DUF4328 domain-containing protein n=1 Tax=Streptomyces netropsis TaxID=55404 RepID=A0A7W7LAU0_STRNE|nr:DUF4328 domain-containing protein [Streptomyces netropsis]MBB4886241.1 hypothetical protein [Streptomyces netropsis]GGR15458.1 hypothetical protein GCM10010219_20460 [Streptomyces netropsis]
MGVPAPPYPYAGALPVGGVDLRRGVRIALTVLLWVNVPMLLLVIGARGRHRAALQDFLDSGLSLSAAREVDDAEAFAVGVDFLYLLLIAATAVLWVIWFRRARLNAEYFAPGTHRFGAGWAAGAWFTPVVNLWFPKQIANDIYRASSPAGPHNVRKGLLNSWWTLWVTGMAFSLVGSATYSGADVKIRARGYDASAVEDDIHTLMTGVSFTVFSRLLFLVAAVLAALLVGQLTKMQEQRAMAGPQAGFPQPGYPQPGYPQAGFAQPGHPQAGFPGYPPAQPGPQPGSPYGPGGPAQNPFGSGPAGY